MKKMLMTGGGLLFFCLPAMADTPTGLDLSNVIKVTEDPISQGCSGPSFQGNFDNEHPLNMAAVYVGNCPAGQYMNVANDASVGNDGTVSGVTCVDCIAGNFCPGVTNPSINNYILSTQGMTACAAGTYTNTTGLSACSPCSVGSYADSTGATSCTAAAAGYYVDTTGASSPTQCPVGYRAGTSTGTTSIAGCQKLITSCTDSVNNFKNGTMTPADWTNDENYVSGVGLYVNYRDTDNHCFGSLTCNPGYSKQNAYAWLANNLDKNVSTSGCAVDGTMKDPADPDGKKHIPCPDTVEAGTVVFEFEDDSGLPVAQLNMVTTCATVELDAQNNPIMVKAHDALNGTETGIACWYKNVDLPNQPWFLTNVYDLKDGYDAAAKDCAETCGLSKPFSAMNDSIKTQMSGLMNQIALLYPDSKFCVANSINIAWGDVTLDENDPAKTCTYGGDLTTPNVEPSQEGFKFLGWKVVSTNNNN